MHLPLLAYRNSRTLDSRCQAVQFAYRIEEHPY